MLKAMMFLLPLALTIFALIDCIQTENDDVRHLPKIGWIVVILLIVVVGPIAWLVAGRDRGTAARRVRPATAGPIAPDDDPEFLRRIDEMRRKRARERRDDDPDEPPGSNPPKR